MIEPTITAEDLSLYALGLLEGDEQAQVDAMLRKSTAAREELAKIRGDLALFALAAEQHTPPALTRQRLLKQVARERRTVPVNLPVGGERGSGQTFSADRDALPRSNGAPASSRSPVSNGQPKRIPQAAESDDSMDPVAQQILAGDPKTVQTRTFPTRTQQMRVNAAAAPAPRAKPEPPVKLEATSDSFTSEAGSFLAEPASYGVDHPSFAADPRMFPREARTLETSATAHSVTMFEQHFATVAAPRTLEPELPPDPDVYSGRRRKEADPLSDVQDRFTPSTSERQEPFAFSSYRDREAEDARGGVAQWIGWAGWAVAGTIAIAALLTVRDDFNLREHVSQQESSIAATEVSAGRAQTVLQTLQSPSSQQFLLGRTDAAPSPSGRVTYLPERGTLVFQGSNLETLQPYKTYELWLIPAGEGRQPLPAGLFKPDGKGYATVILPQMPKGVVAANFGVTIEDEGGSAVPTLPIILVSQGS